MCVFVGLGLGGVFPFLLDFDEHFFAENRGGIMCVNEPLSFSFFAGFFFVWCVIKLACANSWHLLVCFPRFLLFVRKEYH